MRSSLRSRFVDPDLLASCPPELIAANGMDALTQLLESYLSTRANPLTDALALSGSRGGARRLARPGTRRRSRPGRRWSRQRRGRGARERMAYAALCSGICLAQAGLGAVHGLASPLGALFPIPHGVACGATLAAATRVNIAALEERAPGSAALVRYAEAGRLLAGEALRPTDGDARSALVALLDDWRARLAIPRLSAFGIAESDIPAIVADSRGCSMKTNPIVLTRRGDRLDPAGVALAGSVRSPPPPLAEGRYYLRGEMLQDLEVGQPREVGDDDVGLHHAAAGRAAARLVQPAPAPRGPPARPARCPVSSSGARTPGAVTSAGQSNRAARIREAGAKPALSRNCERGAAGQSRGKPRRATGRPGKAASGRRPAATIRKPGDLTERRTSPTCADRMGGLRRRGPLRQAGQAAGGTMRIRLVASAILATLLSVPLGLAAPSHSPRPSRPIPIGRRRRSQLPLAAQRADGSIDGSIGETADFVIGTAAAGFDPATLRGCAGATRRAGLPGHGLRRGGRRRRQDRQGGAGGRRGRRRSRPRFAGRDLLARLAALYHSDTGAYGDGSTFAQSFAILGVEAAGRLRARRDAVDGAEGSPGLGRQLELRRRARGRRRGRHQLDRHRAHGPGRRGRPLGRRRGPGLPAHSAADRRRLPLPELVDVRTSGERPRLRRRSSCRRSSPPARTPEAAGWLAGAELRR